MINKKTFEMNLFTYINDKNLNSTILENTTKQKTIITIESSLKYESTLILTYFKNHKINIYILKTCQNDIIFKQKKDIQNINISIFLTVSLLYLLTLNKIEYSKKIILQKVNSQTKKNIKLKLNENNNKKNTLNKNLHTLKELLNTPILLETFSVSNNHIQSICILKKSNLSTFKKKFPSLSITNIFETPYGGRYEIKEIY
ncbi:hypothetical protein DID78_02745 [Candidatus Marinamargulisbacteria bacterium SCGC AG-343-D04]|nr:hypothetical protein DID78_02745 [Candidatus Marinamargulisbacteria bacterium SCGC AG-343-D04]